MLIARKASPSWRTHGELAGLASPPAPRRGLAKPFDATLQPLSARPSCRKRSFSSLGRFDSTNYNLSFSFRSQIVRSTRKGKPAVQSRENYVDACACVCTYIINVYNTGTRKQEMTHRGEDCAQISNDLRQALCANRANELEESKTFADTS